jgi:hypothetical protein
MLSMGRPAELGRQAPGRIDLESPAIVPVAALDDPGDLGGSEGDSETGVPVVLADVRTESGESSLTGVFRRTGSSIVKTGARTGASIFDAVRVVSGVMRRAIPTN